MNGDEREHVAAVDTTVAILGALQERKVAGVTELARMLDISKANVHKHLVTLCDHGFLRRAGDKYQLGFRFFELGSEVRNGEALFREAATSIHELAAITDKVATLTIQDGDAGVYIYSIDPQQDSGPGMKEGTRIPLYETAPGRAILARCSDDERDSRLPDALDEETVANLTKQFRTVEERGVAIAGAADKPGLREVAAPVTVDDDPLGAVGLFAADAGDASKQLESNYTKLVKKTAGTVSKRMQLCCDSDPSPE